MKQRVPRLLRILFIVLAAFVLAAFGGAVSQAAPNPTPNVPSAYASLATKAQSVPVRLLVTLRLSYAPEAGMSPSVVQSQRSAISAVQNKVIASLDKTVGAKYTLITAYQIFPIVALEADASTVVALANSPDVISIQEDIPVPPDDLASNAVIGAPAAWASGYDGTGWAVAVLDTGVQTTHPFLAGKTVAEACFSTTNAGQGSVSNCPNGQSTSGNNPGQSGAGAGVNCPINVSGCEHGTHVSGIAVGHDYSGGPGYDGVARGANLIAIQVFSKFTTTAACGATAPPCVLSYTSDELAALQYIATTLSGSYNIASINMSLGGGGSNTSACDTNALKPAVDALRALNIATVIAAGNNGFTNGLSSPACISTAISVGATDNLDNVASFSNRANYMSLYAPGVSVNSSVPVNSFENLSGTSMSTPHTAGAWAVLKQRNPSASVATVLSALQSTGHPITNSGFTVPRIQLDAALGSVATPTATWTQGGPTATPTSTPTASSTSTATATAGTLIVTNLNDSGAGSLRAVVGGAGPGSTITFQGGLSGTITLTSGEIAIFKNLTIQGPGARVVTIDGGSQFRAFNIGGSASTVSISGLTLTNGAPNGDGGAILSAGAGVTVSHVAFINNNAGTGQGGAVTLNGGTSLIDASTFKGNVSTSGGALRVNAPSVVTVQNSTFTANNSTTNGGAIRNFSTLTVLNSTLAYNTATGNGGDIANGGTATLTNSIFFGSTAATGPDIQGSFTSGDYNDFGTITGATITPGANDLVSVDPTFATFGNNGGQTDTFVPLNATLVRRIPAPASCALTVDQRDVTRPSTGFCTVGSVELANSITATPTSTNTPGPSPTSTATSTASPTASPTATLAVPPGALFDSITGATHYTSDGGTPESYLGQPFTVSSSAGQLQITKVDVALVSVNAQAYTDLQVNVRFWNNFNAAGTSVFSNPAGSVYTFDLGSANLAGSTVYTITGLQLSPPLTLSSTSNLGVAFNFKGNIGAGLVDTDNLTTGIRYGQPAFAAGTVPLPAPNYGYYANNPNSQTNFNFDPSEEFNAGVNTSLGMRIYGTIIPPTATATNTATVTSSPTRTNTATVTSTATVTTTPTATSTPLAGRIDSVGVYRGGTFYLRLHNTTGFADTTVAFNPPGTNLPIVGDWTGQNYDAVGVFDKTTANFTLCTQNSTAACANVANQIKFTLGSPNDTPLSGRWQLSATHAGAGVYRPSNGVLYLKNALTTGFADNAMVLGLPGDEGIAGDWTGKGFDSPGVYRPGVTGFFLSNQVTNGPVFADITLTYGAASDLPIAGDWIGQGHDGVGMFRPSNGNVYLKNVLTSGFANNTFFYGTAGDQPVAGHWQAVYPPAPPAPVLIAKTAAPNSGGSVFVPGDNQIGG